MSFEQVRALIAQQLNLNEEEITRESRLVDDLHADSLDIVELVMSLEEEIGNEISDDELSKLKTVGDIVAYVEN
ncbi:MAG: acyl carrier protein [Clostridiales bacterium]|nr:acyl carrier protein [Clostridiales bacterium]